MCVDLQVVPLEIPPPSILRIRGIKVESPRLVDLFRPTGDSCDHFIVVVEDLFKTNTIDLILSMYDSDGSLPHLIESAPSRIKEGAEGSVQR